MLKKYRNELYILINETNLNPLDFTITETDYGSGTKRSLITYKETQLCLIIDESPRSFHQFKASFSKFEKNIR